ncbi:hypothetical protein AAHC03_021162 [Spirometra sp. Aus1]
MRKDKVSPAHKHINVLYQQARSCLVPPVDSEDAGLQGRILICRSFVRQLLCLAKKSRVRLSPVMRRSICRSCFVILEPSVTCRLRFRKRRLITRCEACGAVSHLPVPSGVWQPCYFEEVLVDSRRWNSSVCSFDPKHLKVLACPLSKKPLKFDESQQKLVNEELNVAYSIIDGIPCLIPEEGEMRS